MLENKPVTTLSELVADEVMAIHKIVEHLSIFPEKATEDELNKLRGRLSRLVDPANKVVSNVSSLEDATNLIYKRTNQLNNLKHDYSLQSTIDKMKKKG